MKMKKAYFLIVLFLCGLSVGNVFAAAPAAGRLGQELINAARKGNKAKVEKLIAAGADVNATDRYGWTALMQAAIRGHDEDIVKMLLQAEEIDVNAATHQSGLTALMLAARWGHADIVEKLLQVDGIDVNAASPYGLTALIAAVYNGRENIVKMLLDAGADKDLQNNNNQTAEAVARAAGRENLVSMIKDYVRSGRTVKSARKTG